MRRTVAVKSLCASPREHLTKRRKTFRNKIDAGQVYLMMATLLDSVMVAGGRFGGATQREALSSMEGKGAADNEASRDRAAFVVMVERHGEVLYRVALALLRHREDAEDAVQNALLKLYRTGAWRKATNERAFLARTVWRAALDRHHWRARGEESLEDESGETRFFVSSAATPEAAVMVEEREARLWGMVEALPLELRAPLMLAAIEGLTTREIAAALELHEGTVRTRIHRAKVELRRRFEAGEDRGGLR
jgi:RNA polymerase sigma-70 factor (ECF subfamily)